MTTWNPKSNIKSKRQIKKFVDNSYKSREKKKNPGNPNRKMGKGHQKKLLKIRRNAT